MKNDTIVTDSPIGKRLNVSRNTKKALIFGNRTIPLVAKISIGRDSNCDICIDNKLCSRRHAIIQKIKNGFYISDLGSTNGTFINGNKIKSDEWVRLNPGDVITVGKAEIVMN